MLSQVSAWILPGMIAATLIVALARRIEVYDEFVAGARDGVKMGLRLIPLIIAIYIAIGVFRESGALEGLTALLSPVLTLLGLPADLLPLMAIRPFSSSAAMGLIAEVLETHGPDSFVGRLASVMQGSSETTFYVLTLYLGSVGIRRSLYTLPLLLFGDAVGYAASVWVVTHFFS